MSIIKRLREQHLKIKQADLAKIAGVNQATVSRWERGELEPSLGQVAAIRQHAISIGIAWDDAWIFEPASPLLSVAE